MAHPIYKVDGKRVPSVTTCIPKFSVGGLLHWAWKEGVEGRDYRETRDSAANIGTIVHDRIEAHIRQLEWDYPPDLSEEIRGQIDTSFGAFLSWEKQSKMRLIASEVSLTSKKYNFGGTMDVIMAQDQRSLGDWKTGSGIYAEALIQVAAYKNLWEENFPEQPITGGYHILRIDRDTGDFAHRYYPELDAAWEAFKHCRALYDLQKGLAKRAR